MKKIVCIIVFILCCISFSVAQNDFLHYYYADGVRQYWETDSTSVNIIVQQLNHYHQIADKLSNIFNSTTDTVIADSEDDNIIVISNSLSNVSLGVLQNLISVSNDDISFISYSKKIEKSRLWLRNDIYIQLVDSLIYDNRLNNFLSNYQDIELKYEGGGLYRVSSSSEAKLLYIANTIHDSSFVLFATPDFYSESSTLTEDPLYMHQWNMKNNYYLYDSVNGYDINIENAWRMLGFDTGLLVNSVRVAIIDDGVEPHEDMLDQNDNSRVIQGYTVNNNGMGYPVQTGEHGEWCAGIIAASHNDKQIAGISPNTIIIPIRIYKHNFGDYNLTFSARKIANGIIKAYKDFDADILNCSWKHRPNDMIGIAITDALLQGRNGKGCVVVAASGNDGLPDVVFPASRPGVISVGSINKTGEMSYLSNYGEKLSVVAPGNQIYTLDREGAYGCNNGNYNPNFSGTSASAPHVSGVAALMLTINPDLNSSQVKNIIETTANRVTNDPPYYYHLYSEHPNGPWNTYLGYGLVDAFESVKAALLYGYDNYLIGPTTLTLCNEYVYNLWDTVPDGCTLEWETSDYLHVSSGQGTRLVVINPICQSNYNWIKLHIKYNDVIVKTLCLDSVVVEGPFTPLAVNSDSVMNINTIWNDVQLLGYEIIIDSGVVLTITDTIYIAPSSRIIVRPGGKLVVDGGTLTSACAGEMWQGIILEGHTSLPQTAACQGTVQLLNGATIENALCGILTCNPADSLHTTGGIITADSATFRNCVKAVEYLPFVAHNNIGYVTDNWGSFNNCTFTVDDNNLFAANNTDFLSHVTMRDVKGVGFTRCRFEDVRTQSHTRKSAISTIDAGFKIKNGCDYTLPLSNPDCNCYLTTNTYCSFTGFGTAISAATSGNPYAVTIDGARFIDNVTGVGISGNSHAEVTRCIFHLDSIIPDYRSVTGLSLSGCTGNLVEENTFTRVATSPSGNRYGIQVVASGTDMNSLYRNTFERLTRGITVSGINGDGDSHTGLQMTCNGFTNNTYDMYIASGATVCDNQGSTSKGADNTFSGTQTSSLYNIGGSSVNYYYSVASGHAPTNPYNVMISGTATANLCGSTICGYNPGNPGGGPKSPTPGFLSLKEQYDNLMADFNRNGYAEVLEHADDNTYDAATIAAAENAAQQISAIAAELHAQSHATVRALMADTQEDIPAIWEWLNATPGLASRYLAVEAGFVAGANTAETHDRASLQDVATHLTTAAERDEYDNYVAFQALKDALSYGNGHVAWPHATDAQVWELVRIADANTGRSSLLAKNVLCFFFGICYDDDMETRALTTTTIPPQAEPTTLTSQQRITVHPNPTHDMLRVAVTEGDADIARVEMFDMFGRAIRNSEFKIQNSKFRIQTRNISQLMRPPFPPACMSCVSP